MQSKVYSIQFSFSTIVQIFYYDLGVEVKKGTDGTPIRLAIFKSISCLNKNLFLNNTDNYTNLHSVLSLSLSWIL